MLLLLIFFLVIMAIVVYIVNGHDFLSPSFLVTVFFIIGAFFSFWGNLKWGIELNDARFIFAIVGGLASILLGEMFVYKKKTSISTISPQLIKYNSKKIILLIAIDAFILYLYYKRIYQIAVATGFSDENIQMYVRVATACQGVKIGFFFTVFLWIIQTSSIICLFIFINNTLIRKNIHLSEFILLIPTIVYFIQIFLSGARAGLIRLFIIFVFLLFFLIRLISKRINFFKMFAMGIAILSLLLYLFSWLGTFTKKVNDDDYMSPIYTYTGGSIIALDEWFQRNQVFSSDYFGQASFDGLHAAVIF